MNGLKYEFKDIKDVDLSKLEDGKPYFMETTTGGACFSGLAIKNNYHIRDITHILLPCSPIETDKLTKDIIHIIDYYVSQSNETGDHWLVGDKSAGEIVDLLLPHLSGSKEVEVSDEERNRLIVFLMDIDECYGMHVRVNAERCVDEYLLKNFVVRDKQGIAPCKVEEKSKVCGLNREPNKCSINLYTEKGCSTCKQFLKEWETK